MAFTSNWSLDWLCGATLAMYRNVQLKIIYCVLKIFSENTFTHTILCIPLQFGFLVKRH